MDVSDAERGSDLHVDAEPGSDELPQTQHSSEKDNLQRRLQTFVKWVGLVFPTHLAIAGFIFTGPGDQTKCESCGLKVSGWTKEDIPLDVHRIRSPRCGFLEKWFPLKSQINNLIEPAFNFDVLFDSTKAKYQDFVTFVRRLASFDVWPQKNEIQSPRNMSLAGFLYVGSSDRARCFNCGITLRDWDTDDDPFEAHMAWSPKCEYIQLVQEQRKKTANPTSIRNDQNSLVNNTYASHTYSTSNTFSSSASSSNSSSSRCPSTDTSSSSRSPSTDTSSSSRSPSTNTSSSSPRTSYSSSSRWKHSVQVEAVLSMGYPEELVQEVIARRREEHGEDFPDAVSLFSAVEALAEIHV